MTKNMYRLFFASVAVATLLTAPVFADLGLAQLAAQPKGSSAVGQAVLDAVRAIYAGTSDSAAIQSQLISILNEAAATGNLLAIRDAIAAVMIGGGAENLGLSKSAITASDVFSNYQQVVKAVVPRMEALLGGGGQLLGGGQQLGGGDKEMGGGDKELGGGDPTWFPFWDSFPSDNDLPATRI
ncbi:MAG: hypothetical protein WCG03_02600 [Kiritimatiellales bacterium]